jgi:acetyl/propionyl-CoA carboxylase alpha subunit
MPKTPIAASCPRPVACALSPAGEGWTDDGAENGRRGVDGVRVDDGVYEGGEVSMFYDPMIAKLITWGKTRDEAADKQIAALDPSRSKGWATTSISSRRSCSTRASARAS